MMPHTYVLNNRNHYWPLVWCTLFAFLSISAAKTVVPLFLFSGQSNMAGFGDAGALTASQKEKMEHILINVGGHCDQSKKGKWLPLGPGFGNTSSKFGPELAFGKTLTDSMPNTKMAFIKYSVRSTTLGSDFLPPSSNNGNGGKEYNNLTAHISNAMESFNTVFDPSEYTLQWAGLIWLQGESDAKGGGLPDKYEANLENLIKDIRSVAKADALPIILPLITTASRWKQADKIRAADVAIREKLENVDTLETDGFHLPDGMHYDAEGQIIIGHISAVRWLAMGYMKKSNVSIVHSRPYPLLNLLPLHESAMAHRLFDVSGRRLKFRRNAAEQKPVTPYFLY